MPFIDIAFQAEVSRYEDPEFEEFATRNCNEIPDTRVTAIEELRRMVYERAECSPRRVDDAYLLRFLRCRRFIPALAYKLMVRYEDFRKQNAHLYNCDAFGLHRVKNLYASTFPDSPENGRIFLMRFGNWNPEEVSVEDALRCALFMDEVAIMQPKLQILGVTIVVDLEGLSLRYLRYLTPTVANQIVSLMGISFPLPLRRLHVINYSWILNSFIYVFKQFVPSAAWDRIRFHGNIDSLHKEIDPKYLPSEYGGTCRHVFTVEEWIQKINKYKDDFMVQELRDLGFTVKDEKRVHSRTDDGKRTVIA